MRNEYRVLWIPKTGRAFCSTDVASSVNVAKSLKSTVFSTALSIDLCTAADREAAAAKEFEPTTEFHGIKNPDGALLLAGLRRQVTLQKFERVAPISDRETPRGPGVWAFMDADVLQGRAKTWTTQTESKKEEVSELLWTCFNRMFPPATEADEKEWYDQRWYEPSVTLGGPSEHYSTTYDVCSVGGVDGSCLFKFQFERDLQYVKVTYEGPVRFDLDVVESARVREMEARDRRRREAEVALGEGARQRRIRQQAALSRVSRADPGLGAAARMRLMRLNQARY